MAHLSFTVVQKDGDRVQVSAGPVEQVAFEHHFKVGLGRALQDVHIEHLYWLAWKGMQAAGHTVPLFSDWLGQVVDVEFGGEGKAAPLDLQADQSPG